jgi:hypothetical protein
MQLHISVTIACIFIVGCGNHKKNPDHKDPFSFAPPENSPNEPSNKPPADPTVPWKPKSISGIVFATIDPVSSPWQASVHWLDLKSQAVSRLLTGESGDPALFFSGGEVLFFNRSYDSQNYRRLVSNSRGFTPTPQMKFAGGSIGDPHDALYLGNDRVLLAHYAEGRLVVMRQSTGEELSSVQADWDLPSGVTLKPESMIFVERNGESLIYVTHQGLSTHDNLLVADGTQRIYVLKDSGTAVEAVDLDASDPKIQGIKLHGTAPMVVRFQRRSKVLVVGMCSRLVLASTSDPAKMCQSAVEEIDVATNSSSVAWDLNDRGFYMNGPVVPGPTENTFFANVEQKMGPRNFERSVVRFNIEEQSTNKIYSFMPDSGGFWASLYDEARQTLYVGDIGESSIGKFVIFPQGGDRSELSLEGVPYSVTAVVAGTLPLVP